MQPVKGLPIVNIEDIPEFFQLNDEVYLFSLVLHVNEPKAFKKFWKVLLQSLKS